MKVFLIVVFLTVLGGCGGGGDAAPGSPSTAASTPSERASQPNQLPPRDDRYWAR